MIKKVLLSITTALAAIAAYTLFLLVLPSYTTQPIPVYNDTYIINQLKQVGATHFDNLNVQYDELPIGTRGLYWNGTIKVAEGIPNNIQLKVLAHEYLHYIWLEVMTEDKRVELSDKLEALYAQDKDMQRRMQVYKDRGLLSPTELFSIYCTESTDSYMLTIVDECNKYIDRSKLVLTR